MRKYAREVSVANPRPLIRILEPHEVELVRGLAALGYKSAHIARHLSNDTRTVHTSTVWQIVHGKSYRPDSRPFWWRRCRSRAFRAPRPVFGARRRACREVRT